MCQKVKTLEGLRGVEKKYMSGGEVRICCCGKYATEFVLLVIGFY